MDWRDISDAVLAVILLVLTLSAYGLAIMLAFLLWTVVILFQGTIVAAVVVFLISPFTQITLMSYINCLIEGMR